MERLYHETSDRLEAALLLSSSHVDVTGSKPDMIVYMTAWLRDNWINPYPDDVVLSEMAAHCGTTPTIIGNWLINTRTRKWRPAIVKAMQLNRLAAYLLEDSLCFFDGRPVRPLNEMSRTGYSVSVVTHQPSLIADQYDWELGHNESDELNI